MRRLKSPVWALAGLLVWLSAGQAPAQDWDPAYETRAQEAVAGLSRLNGLRGWTPEAPGAWPALEGDPARLRRGGGRTAAGAVFQAGRPARLTALALLNLGLERAADLSGLSALTALDISGNNLRGLNLEGNEALIFLAALNNQLPALDLSSAPRLTNLDLSGNTLTQLDLAANPDLTEIALSRNRLTALDLSRHRLLTRLEVASNQLPALELSANPGLTRLMAAYNRLEGLSLAANPLLTEVSLKSNRLTRLDLSQNPALRVLAAGRNQLTSLDLSRNPLLTRLEVMDNRLSALDLSANPRLEALEAQGNPLTELALAEEAPLVTLNLDGARLPLSRLAPLVGRAQSRARFGRQSRVLFEERGLKIRETLDLSTEADFGGEPTVFTVLTEKGRRVRPDHYSLEGGRLRFNIPGRYLVEMSNSRVFSSEKYGAAARPRRFKVKAVTGVIEVAPEL
jgi:hypothetical protein